MKIILDAMGGDNAPLEIVKGSILAVEDDPKIEIILVGREAEVKKAFTDAGCRSIPERISVVNADDVVSMEDDPVMVVRTKKESSMIKGIELLNSGAGDAFISAGSTGALMTAGTLLVKRIRGVRRAAIAIEYPNRKNGSTLIVDCGANAECTPEYLSQFASMGSVYMETLRGIKSPTVALLNIGTEETKGTSLQKQTYEMLQTQKDEGKLNFSGNTEARDIYSGDNDVIVTDGYSGNILLKTTEGTSAFITELLNDVFKKNLIYKICYRVMKKGIREFKKKMDYTEVGGSPLLGISKPVIKAHGASNAKAVHNAIRQAKGLVETDFISRITESISSNKAE